MKIDNIKCPKCNWQPKPIENSWICSCKHVWNTFETGGQCPNPKCKRIWQDTQCLQCHQWSPHISFYSDFSKLLKKELDNLNDTEPKKESNESNKKS